MSWRWWLLAVIVVAGWPGNSLRGQDALRDEASAALQRAVAFYRGSVAKHGGYVYRYGEDLKKSEGEEKTGPDTVWVQPPGTPAVGLAYLEAYERLKLPYLLDAAQATGLCLVQGQLRSGAWAGSIEFASDQRARYNYRVDPPPTKRASNISTFDDDKSQSAMRLLIRLDRAHHQRDEKIHESITVALDSVVRAQYPNGAWGQGFDSFPEADPQKYPVVRASYPDSWPRKHPAESYWRYYTFNDNTVADTIDMLLLAAEVYGEPRYREAALRAGDFILLAQLPEPQPAWAQQYDFQMHPVWARKFEPPAISGGESQGLIQILMTLYVETADRKYLEPIPRALAYLRRSALSDGRLSRFYELQTNKPLYLTRAYELTYDDHDLPTHYGFKVSSRADSLAAKYEKLAALNPQKLASQRTSRAQPSLGKPSDRSVRAVIAALDSRGAWVEDGKLSDHGPDDATRRVIDSRTFIRNIGILSQYLAQPR